MWSGLSTLQAFFFSPLLAFCCVLWLSVAVRQPFVRWLLAPCVFSSSFCCALWGSVAVRQLFVRWLLAPVSVPRFFSPILVFCCAFWRSVVVRQHFVRWLLAPCSSLSLCFFGLQSHYLHPFLFVHGCPKVDQPCFAHLLKRPPSSIMFLRFSCWRKVLHTGKLSVRAHVLQLLCVREQVLQLVFEVVLAWFLYHLSEF